MKNNYLSLTLKNTLKLSSFLPKKKNLIIKNKGNYYLLMKVYIVVSEDLKYLIHSKKYLYLYYPIKIINYSTIKKYLSDLNDNKYKICSNKEEIINEVRLFLGIENDCFNFKYNIYDENLNLITNDYQLSQNIKNIKNNINNIIYIKVVQLKNGEIKHKREKYQFNKKLNGFFLEKKIKKKQENQKLNILDEILNNVNKKEKNISNAKEVNFHNIGRNKKINNNLLSIDSYRSFSKKINKNTSTDDLEIKKNNKINNINNINNNKYPLFNSFTSRSFNYKKRNSRNKISEKIQNNCFNKRTNLSSPDYYKTIKKKFNIKMSIKENHLLKIPLKKNNFFNNKFINNIFLKNNFFNNKNDFMKTLSEKYLTYNSFFKETKKPLILSHSKFNSYFNSNINIYNQNLNEIYFDNKSFSPIKKNNYYNIRLYI